MFLAGSTATLVVTLLLLPVSCAFAFAQPASSLRLAGGSGPGISLRMGSGASGGGSPSVVQQKVYKKNWLVGVLGYLSCAPGDPHVVLNNAVGGEEVKVEKPAEEVRKSITALYGSFVNEEGTGVDYARLEASEEFKEFVKLSSTLATASPADMTADERLAFLINVYNTLVIHALVALGTPANLLSRLRLYASASYTIGGQVLSLNEIENGCIRANRKPPGPFSRPYFGREDPRLAFCLPSPPDPRIHFGLNCGAKGCPPIRFYKAENLDASLDRATKGFFGSAEVDEASGEIRVSQILQWYKVDFEDAVQVLPGGAGLKGDAALLHYLVPYLNDEKQEVAKKLIEKHTAKLVFQPYDWGLNSK